jgi:hypothetical protein
MKLTILTYCLLLTTTTFARPRGVLLDDELRYAKFVGTVVIDNYDGKGGIYFHSTDYKDTISKAFGNFYGTDGLIWSNPVKTELTTCTPFKKDTVLIVIDTNNRVSLFAKILADKYRFWSPYFTGSLALFRFSYPAEILDKSLEVKELGQANGKTYLACWDGCYLKKEYLKSFNTEKGEHTTLVLPIVGLDIRAISSGNSAVLWFGACRIKPNFISYYLTLSESQAAVPGGRI